MDYQKPARSARTSRRRSPAISILWTGMAVILTAVFLPAAISIASTGSLGAYTVVGALTGAKPEKKNERPVEAAIVPAPETTPADDARTSLTDEPPAEAKLERGDNRRQDGRRTNDQRERTDRADASAHKPAGGDRGAKNDDDKPKGDDTAAPTPEPTTPVAEAPAPATEDKPAESKAPVHTPAAPRPAAPLTAPAPAPAPAPADAGTDDTSDDLNADTSAADTPAEDAATAEGRRTFLLDEGESVSVVVPVAEGETAITLWAHKGATECQERLAVLLDRRFVDIMDVTGSEWQSHTIEAGAGTHSVRLVSIGEDTSQQGEDAVVCSDDPAVRTITVIEPKAGEAGMAEPAATDAAATDETTTDGPTTDPTTDGTTTDPTTDGTTTDPTTDGTTTDPTTDGLVPGTDGTVDAGPDATVTDDRRQFVLYRGENVTLNLDAPAEGDTVTLWTHAKRDECRPVLGIWVDNHVVDVIEIRGTEWQSHTVEVPADAGRTAVRLGVVGTEGDRNCSRGESRDSVTLVEPTSGEAGTVVPAVVDVTTPDSGTDAPPAGGEDPSTPTTPDGGSTDAPSSPGAGDSSGGAGLLWSGDFEDALADFADAPWNHANAPTPAAMTVGGSKVGKFDVPAGVGRSELVGTGPASALSNGQIRYFAWSTFLPSDFVFSPKWRVLAQWKNAGTGSPPLELKLLNDKWHLDGGWNGGSCADKVSDQQTAWTGTAARGRWTNFVLGVKFQEGYAGWVELWQDGKQVLSRKAWRTLYSGCTSYLKLGLYRDPSLGTRDIVYHDNWKMGTTYESVTG